MIVDPGTTKLFTLYFHIIEELIAIEISSTKVIPINLSGQLLALKNDS